MVAVSVPGRTIVQLIISGASTVWKGVEVNIDYSYISVELEKYLVLYKINPMYDGYDDENTISIGVDSQAVFNLITKVCENAPEECAYSEGKNYISISTSHNPVFDIFYLKADCDAYIYYKGDVDKQEKHRAFVEAFFDDNCYQ